MRGAKKKEDICEACFYPLIVKDGERYVLKELLKLE